MFLTRAKNDTYKLQTRSLNVLYGLERSASLLSIFSFSFLLFHFLFFLLFLSLFLFSFFLFSFFLFVLSDRSFFLFSFFLFFFPTPFLEF